MNIYSIKIFFLIQLVVCLNSCKKKPYEPENPQNIINNAANVDPVGINWELYSGRVFVTNLDNGNKSYYDHFAPTKIKSNLDVFWASWLPIDNIALGTNWKFTSAGQFILDTTNYNYSIYNGTYSVYGLENGSARPIEILRSTNDYMTVKIYESNGNNGINNYSFYSFLTFVRVGYTGSVTEYPSPFGYTYGGLLGGSIPLTPPLIGTKWIVTHVLSGLSNTYPNDTLNFINNTQYTINSSAARSFNLSGIISSNMKSLSLYSFTTLGGDWSGEVQGTFINDSIINNATFKDLFHVSPNVKVWMKRLQ